MIIKQVELKDINIKSLKSLDKSIKLTFYINLNDNNTLDINQLHKHLFKPIVLGIEEEKY